MGKTGEALKVLASLKDPLRRLHAHYTIARVQLRANNFSAAAAAQAQNIRHFEAWVGREQPVLQNLYTSYARLLRKIPAPARSCER